MNDRVSLQETAFGAIGVATCVLDAVLFPVWALLATIAVFIFVAVLLRRPRRPWIVIGVGLSALFVGASVAAGLGASDRSGRRSPNYSADLRRIERELNSLIGALASRVPSPLPRVMLPEVRDALVSYLNTLREKKGLSAVTQASSLTQAAQDHVDEMVSYHFFSDEDREGRSLLERLERPVDSPAGFVVGEVNAYDQKPAVKEVFEQWTASPPHRVLLLSPQFTQVGVGVAQGTIRVLYRGTIETFANAFVVSADFAGTA